MGQGLFNLVPDLELEDEGRLPLRWTLGVDLGYDDNVNAGGAIFGLPAEDSFFLRAFIQATYAHSDARTNYQLDARLGAVYFFDQVNTGFPGVASQSVNNRLNSDTSISFNLNHRINERLRYRTNNTLAYQLEPDMTTGLAANRQLGSFLTFITDHSIGYEMTPRYGLVLGYRFNGIYYEDFVIENRIQNLFYTQMRYKASERTVWTLNYRFGITTREGNAGLGDATNHFFTAGIEHRVNPRTAFTFQAGAQYRDVDGGVSNTAPFAELGLNSRLTDQFSVRLFSRLMMEDGEIFAPFGLGGQYDQRLVLRSGLTGNYVINPQLSLFGGVTHIRSSFRDGNGLGGGFTPPDFDEDLINLNFGFNYQLYQNMSVVGSYNYTNSMSDVSQREFDRNRFTLGIRTTF